MKFEQSQVIHYDFKRSSKQDNNFILDNSVSNNEKADKFRQKYQINESEIINQNPSETQMNFEYQAQTSNKKKIVMKTYNIPEPLCFGLLSCCKSEPQTQAEFEQCYVCKRRNHPFIYSKPSKTPYISTLRMKNRQKQPIFTFYDRNNNDKLLNERWK